MKFIREIIYKLRFVRAFLMLLKDPYKTDLFFEIVEVGRRQSPEKVAESMRQTLASLEFQNLWQNRYTPKVTPKKILLDYPDGSFGKNLGEFLQKNNLDPEFYPDLKIENSVDYLIHRMRRIHDPMHVLTGFDTSVDGELGIQGFVVAQTQSLLSAIIISGGLLHRVLYDPINVKKTLGVIARGYQLGSKAKRLVDQPIEDYFPMPLADVRARLGLPTDCSIG